MEFGGVPFESLPPEVQETLRAVVEHQQHHQEMRNMAIEASRHRMQNFLNSLDAEGLLCLRGLLHMTIADPDNETAGFYLGFTAQLLTKYGYCALCQEKHETAEELLGNGDSEKKVNEEVVDRDALMEEYSLEKSTDGRIRCANCGQQYTSLEDRMLRTADKSGCSGCVQKEKWG